MPKTYKVKGYVYDVSIMDICPDDVTVNTAGEDQGTKWLQMGPVTFFFNEWSDLGSIAAKLQYLYLCNAEDSDLYDCSECGGKDEAHSPNCSHSIDY